MDGERSLSDIFGYVARGTFRVRRLDVEYGGAELAAPHTRNNTLGYVAPLETDDV